mgnify:CR=1 FL=1
MVMAECTRDLPKSNQFHLKSLITRDETGVKKVGNITLELTLTPPDDEKTQGQEERLLHILEWAQDRHERHKTAVPQKLEEEGADQNADEHEHESFKWLVRLNQSFGKHLLSP